MIRDSDYLIQNAELPNVTSNAGAKMIGKVTIGENSKVGANVVVVKMSPPTHCSRCIRPHCQKGRNSGGPAPLMRMVAKWQSASHVTCNSSEYAVQNSDWRLAQLPNKPQAANARPYTVYVV